MRDKRCDLPSLFLPENLLREAKRQKNIQGSPIPEVCILDPDGDIVRNLLASGVAVLNQDWACYHTRLYNFEYNGIKLGIVAHAVGASFAVLVAEELFVSGCRLLISITSAGRIGTLAEPPFFIMIEYALRDEGTSYHYLPPSDYARLNKNLLKIAKHSLSDLNFPIFFGATWTTDAPFRETSADIEYARSQNIMAVEMEAAALYAFAQARQKAVACFAHVTNQMGTFEGDFEKGEDDGHQDALELITTLLKAL